MRLDDILESIGGRQQRLIAGQVWARAYEARLEQLDLFATGMYEERTLARKAGYEAVKQYIREAV